MHFLSAVFFLYLLILPDSSYSYTHILLSYDINIFEYNPHHCSRMSKSAS